MEALCTSLATNIETQKGAGPHAHRYGINKDNNEAAIDHISHKLIQLLEGYHDLATELWPLEPEKNSNPPTQMQIALTRPQTKLLKKLAKLKKRAKTLLKRPQHARETNAHQLQTETQQLLHMEMEPKLADIGEAVTKKQNEIIEQAENLLKEKRTQKADKEYDTNPKRFHQSLKKLAGLENDASAQLTAVRDQNGDIVTDPQEAIATVHHYYQTELSRATPNPVGPPPWEAPNAIDRITIPQPAGATPNMTLLEMIDIGFLETAIATLAEGKAPGPDGIPNEIIKHLPESVKHLLYRIFMLMGDTTHTPSNWGLSATCLIFKPNKEDPAHCSSYRPISLMNCILKLWTSTLYLAGVAYVERLCILSNDQHGFRRSRQMLDALYSQIAMLEDAKLHKKDIYTCYIDFKCAFNSTDHDVMFQTLEKMGLPHQYIQTCRDIYSHSDTYYVTPYGNTEPIRVRRGTLQGDSLSPFLFILFIDPLLRWLEEGSRGYEPSFEADISSSTTLTHSDIGYADDLTITTGSLEDMKIQMHKIGEFSKYTKLDLAVTKCEITGALWSRGSPMATENLQALRQQLSKVVLPTPDGTPTPLKFRAPNESYKLLGVHLNTILNFTDHYNHITDQVKKLAQALRRAHLSPDRKLRVVETLVTASGSEACLVCMPTL